MYSKCKVNKFILFWTALCFNTKSLLQGAASVAIPHMYMVGNRRSYENVEKLDIGLKSGWKGSLGIYVCEVWLVMQ